MLERGAFKGPGGSPAALLEEEDGDPGVGASRWERVFGVPCFVNLVGSVEGCVAVEELADGSRSLEEEVPCSGCGLGE